ncbi:MAG TPA: hypothetical protein VK325_08620, partial [Pseudoxanthomonas sp.]|nr:hypothetical protein [Pseudoxanthomonas sp.]
MQRRILSLGLLATALAACQSAPESATRSATRPAVEAPGAKAPVVREPAARESAVLDRVEITGQRLAGANKSERPAPVEAYMPPSPPAPPAPMAQANLRADAAAYQASTLAPPARPGVATDGETYQPHADNPVQRASETP